MITGIYAIRNIVSGRICVGSAANMKRRWALHRSLLYRGKHHSSSLQRSWLKHGEEKFIFEVLEITDKHLLIQREQHWIDDLDAANPQTGFNIAPRAGSSLGRRHPPEIIALFREQRKGRKCPPFSDAHRAAISASRMENQWAKGIPKTEEHKANLSASKRGKKNPAIAKSNRRRRGIKRSLMSAEQRDNLSATRKGRKLGPRTNCAAAPQILSTQE